ncbi:MAG: ABC transporter permease [Actinomycetota bacterium]|nr:ABC transporter permease [Actinomycetota bacterium]
MFLTGFLEPLLYLLSIGIGIEQLVGEFRIGGDVVSYTEFVAPAMLAASAMNGSLFDATFGVFFKLKYEKFYDSVLATPLQPVDVVVGELVWSLLRGGLYACMFVVVMASLGLTRSWWTLLAAPAAVVIGYAFAGAGMALTTWMRSWQDFDFITLAVLPMFLFSATFFPLERYPDGAEWLVQATPLYHGVVLCRGLTTGALGTEMLLAVAYLLVMGSVGLLVASRRFGTLLLR